MRFKILLMALFTFNTALGQGYILQQKESQPTLALNQESAENSKNGKEPKDSNVKPKGAYIYGESRQNRQNKSFDGGIQILGFTVAPIFSRGIYGGIYITPDDIVEIGYYSGSFSFIIFELYAKVFNLNYKKFWGNSFYTNTGLSTREIGGKIGISFAGGLIENDFYNVSVTSLTLDFALGNKWLWDNWNVGCDWLGLQYPLSKIEELDESTTFYSGLSDEDRQDKEAFDRVAKTTSFEFLRFYIGYSF